MRSCSLLLSLLLAAPASAGEPFLDLGFDAASAQARAEGKLLLVDFTWRYWQQSGQTEKVVWPDADVRAWIAEHAVAIQVDEQKDQELAVRFAIESWPIVVLLRDGVEIERHTDFDNAAGFLAWANGALQGRTPQERHAAELREFAEPEVAFELSLYADHLVRERYFEDATQAYIKAWELARRDEIAVEWTLPQVLHRMEDLAKEYPAARTAFEQLLAATQLRTFATDPPRSVDLMQWVKLCVAAGKEQRVVTWFEQTRDDDGLLYGRFFPFDEATNREAMKATDTEAAKDRMIVLEFLIDQRRFDDAARLYEDPVRFAQLLSMTAEMSRSMYSILAAAGDDSSYLSGAPEFIAKKRRREIARIHAVTLASGRSEQAEKVAHLLLDSDDDGLGRIALVEASLDLETMPPADASRWLDEAKALGADVEKARGRLAKAADGDAK